MNNTITAAQYNEGNTGSKHHAIVIGIDPGVMTGVAVWHIGDKRLLAVSSKMIHEAMLSVEACHKTSKIFVRVEDARQRQWFGKSSREVLQGAGSIKRDCKIWEDFLTDLGIDFEMVKPLIGATKWNAKTFKEHTKWQGTTNEHGRDAALLCIGWK